MVDTLEETFPIETEVVFYGADGLNEIPDHLLPANAAAALADESASFQYGTGQCQPGGFQRNGDRIGISTVAKGDLLDLIIGIDDAFTQAKPGHVRNLVAGCSHDDRIRLSLNPDGKWLFTQNLERIVGSTLDGVLSNRSLAVGGQFFNFLVM